MSRERRSPHQEPERMSHQRPQGSGLKSLCAPPRSLTQWMIRTPHARLRPCLSSEAFGSSAPLPYPWRNFGLSNAVSRVSL
jgi:hypothetical protein